MVLWEITLGTAYFLGLKRTYRLALKIQRRLISPKYPKFRQFAHRRTRAAFDMALTFHRNIQQRDIDIGRSVGNWILRWLDKKKPSAEIRGPRAGNFRPKRNLNTESKNQSTKVPDKKTPRGFQQSDTGGNRDSSRRLFDASNLSAISKMTKPANGTNTQYRRMSFTGSEELRSRFNMRAGSDGVIRKDIMQWMLQK